MSRVLTFTLMALFGVYAESGSGTQQAFAAETEKKMTSFFELTTKTLEGTPYDLAQHKGQVVLVVNTASKCGYTPQYEGLQKLQEALAGKQFTVLGFPSNDFGGQEPGDAKEIRNFCTVNYRVKFPLLEKVKTHGAEQHPVYKFLTQNHPAPKWNFHKYLISKDGQVLAAFPSKVAPDSAELKTAIEKALQ